MTKLSGEMLLIRADASVAIGTGHAMRCLALTQAWQDAGGRVTFVMAESTPAIEERLRSEGIGLVRIDGVPGSDFDHEQLIALARTHRPSWVVVDGYEFDAAYQRTLKNEGFKVLLIDDNGRPGSFTADVVLNQNVHAQECLYKNRETYTRLLLGPKYALLRREFVSAPDCREISSIGRKLLVSMGGSDPDNVTCRVMEAIEQVEVADLQVAVVAGGSNPHLASIGESVAKSSHSCRILNNVTDMPALISWADLAISGAGTVCWEYCALGLPAVLVAVAENQIPNAEALHAAGAARLVAGGSQFAIGEMAQLITRLVNSRSERFALSRTAHTLVDGGGAGRIISMLLGEGAS
ncbi:MAG: UDP-2,4-diacetamido-2,4,6-trideoxy-beta-L-altropyranose hydrolase [Acidobacteriia bacterium]|nr:UDP-2,4-diacetamido-2,4,6-trideoxy-beta-L-altropyranose hydrolase [Terriglobia bacterium]